MLAGSLITGCLFIGEKVAGKGGGTETESKVAGLAVNPDGSAAVGVRVTLRPSDYLADLVSTEEESRRMQETTTDAHGRFRLRNRRRAPIASKSPGRNPAVPSATSAFPGTAWDWIWGGYAEAARQHHRLVRSGQRGPVDALHPGFRHGAPGDGRTLRRIHPLQSARRAYDIRCSSLQPFRRDAVRGKIAVRAGETDRHRTGAAREGGEARRSRSIPRASASKGWIRPMP